MTHPLELAIADWRLSIVLSIANCRLQAYQLAIVNRQFNCQSRIDNR